MQKQSVTAPDPLRHAGAVLHDAVPSAIRVGVASAAVSWIGFLPFALTFGSATKQFGLHTAGWMITAATVVVGLCCSDCR